jgi:hypothetical protein
MVLTGLVLLLMEELNLETVVDEKREYPGHATPHELDVTAYRKGDHKLVVFECKRHQTRDVEKGMTCQFAYVLNNVSAGQGYYISWRDLSKGADEVAGYENIGHIKFTVDDTSGTRVVEFLNRCFAANTLGFFISGE